MNTRGRNEFDSSFELWADEIDGLRREFDPDEVEIVNPRWRRSMYGNMNKPGTEADHWRPGWTSPGRIESTVSVRSPPHYKAIRT